MPPRPTSPRPCRCAPCHPASPPWPAPLRPSRPRPRAAARTLRPPPPHRPGPRRRPGDASAPHRPSAASPTPSLAVPVEKRKSPGVVPCPQPGRPYREEEEGRKRRGGAEGRVGAVGGDPEHLGDPDHLRRHCGRACTALSRHCTDSPLRR
ncbi:probable pathogenesis-related protein ARB_02861 [Miscanthus floridulus]|uniref:probable pathogenesis-related protein ARB_02861 n=1 Tax=Miscanthus floridulus TaxID=154761 RepID=UPI003459D15E